MRKLNTHLNGGIRRNAVVAAAPSLSLTVLSSVRTGGSPSPATEHEYAYDPIGNRTSSSDLGTARTYTANNLNQYTEISTLRVG